VFCDDLSFDAEDTTYKSLKAVLEGGIEGRPDNVIFYATSNRRHLMSRDMMENERSTASTPAKPWKKRFRCRTGSAYGSASIAAARTNISRWSTAMSRTTRFPARGEALHREALEWSTTRGSRSGRVAWQFVQDLAGRLGVALKN
jgi:predicted AAA+ superfamily ATPase